MKQRRSETASGERPEAVSGSARVPEEMRLNRYLSAAGVCSRREADRIIGEGRVRVNGIPASLGMVIREEDRVFVDGKLVQSTKREIFLAVNKPAGVVVTTDKSRGGLILMTNNGEASNRIQKARGRHEKEYVVTVDRPFDREFLRKMSAGVYLEELDRTTRPCKIRRLDQNRFDIILTEGLNRQIRRMCLALGYRVQKLKRIRVMNIVLGSLKEGSYRELTPEELQTLKKELGMLP